MEIKLGVFYKEYTTTYLKDRKQELKELEKLVGKQDFEKLEFKFNQIAGSGGAFGLGFITDVARDLEFAAWKADLDLLKDKFNHYKALLMETEIVFK